MPRIAFTSFISPSGRRFLIPDDIELRTPPNPGIDPSLLSALVYIPWNDTYFDNIPTNYRGFFRSLLPDLSVRTTDVHVAVCMPFIAKLGQRVTDKFDERVVSLALILHDIGWSRLSDREIASSLGVTGLALSSAASEPKENHAKVGRIYAEKILATHQFDPPLTATQKSLILDAVQFHDKPWELSHAAAVPPEVKLVCDVDHLWSFTHQNFWQDTVRKSVDPGEYLQNLAQDLNDYFITDQAKALAQSLLNQRKSEVESLPDQ